MSLIKVYCVNVQERTDRREHICKEFSNKPEFDLEIVPAILSSSGNLSLWHTIRAIVSVNIHQNNDYFILCEDDHLFTKNYTFSGLSKSIDKALDIKAGMLSGGVSWFNTAIQIYDGCFWIEKFSGLQFTIVFRQIYQKILDADFGMNDQADYKISALTDHKFLIHPFISIQKEFGYSDVTIINNKKGVVDELFRETSARLDSLRKVRNYYLDKLNS